MRQQSDPIPALKEQLGIAISRQLAGWRATDIAVRLGIEPARVSDLRRGRLHRFSLDRLVRVASRLRLNVRFELSGAGRREPG